MLKCTILLSCLFIGIVGSNANPAKIVIVGSGASGTAAASKLIENGFDNVIVLEAENRTGGRVYTTDLDGYKVDLGAQWIHGEKGNVAFELASNLGLADHYNRTVPYITLYAGAGVTIDPELVKDFKMLYDTLLKAASEFTDEHNGTLGHYFEEHFKANFGQYPEMNETLQRQFLWHFNLLQTSYDGSDSWYDVPASRYSEYKESEGDQAVNWKDKGYGTILDILIKRIPNPEEELPVLNKTYLNTEVAKVDYTSEDGKVKVLTSDGREFLADHVIMTPSLGVLKAEHETMFDPPLPESKINSIKGLGFGAAGKIILAYEEPWWTEVWEETAGFSFLWSEHDEKEYNNDPEKKWMLSTAACVFVEYKPRLLLCWISGEGARWADKVPDELLFNQTQYMLNKFLSPDFNISTPVAMKRSQWTTNKHFLGTYSFRSMDADKLNASAQELSEPIMKAGKPVVLFAGEATSPHHFSTVHGAIETGWREADRIINFYNTDTTLNDEETTEKSKQNIVEDIN